MHSFKLLIACTLLFQNITAGEFTRKPLPLNKICSNHNAPNIDDSTSCCMCGLLCCSCASEMSTGIMMIQALPSISLSGICCGTLFVGTLYIGKEIFFGYREQNKTTHIKQK